MKKMLVFLLTLALLCGMVCHAELGAADVVMEGVTYHLTLTDIGIVDGQLNVVLEGFGDTLRMGANGAMIAGLPEAHYGDEIVHFTNVSLNVGGPFTFTFERAELPDEIWMTSYDEGVAPVVIWRSEDAGETEAAVDTGETPAVRPGDIARFGHWEQDGDAANGAEPIEWIVLDVKDGIATLLSREVLEARAYNGLGMSVTWEMCSLRRWLNGDFFDAAFDDAEKDTIEETEVTADRNPFSPDTDPGANTRDSVYLLSIDEALRYFGSIHIRPAMPTEAAISHGVYVSDTSGEVGTSLWWLRTPGHYSDSATYVVSNNRLMESGNDVSKGNYGVRPVVRTRLSSLEIVPSTPAEPGETQARGVEPVEGSAADFESLSAGDAIFLGRYEQDANPADGAEPIEWIVLKVRNGLATLMSREVLDARAFNGLGMSVKWDSCSLRKWLNGDFLSESFTEAERAALQTVTVTADKNPDKPDMDPGTDTQDTVYLLSILEAADYFGALNIAPALPTRTAIANGIYVDNTSGSVGQTAWWLRTPGGYSDRAAYIISDNSLKSHGGEVGKTNYGIRPVVVAKLSDLSGVAYLAAEATVPESTATPEPTEAPTPEPTAEPTAEPASEPTETPEAADVEAAQIGEDEILAALGKDIYRATYEALLGGEVIAKGSKGEAAKGVQQTLADFGQSISVDGSVGAKTIAALNAVQTAFGLPATESLYAAGYAQLLPRLLIATNPDEAETLLMGSMESGEYDYMRACAMAAAGKYASARELFEESDFGDWEARAAACVQPWPKTGVLYKNPAVSGSSARLTVKFNTEPDTAMLVKVYTADGTLARTMFIGGTGKATTSLPGGTYVIKDGTGKHWYGEEEAFGPRPEGSYEVMTFEDGAQEVQLKKNYTATITVNVQEGEAVGQGVGSDWEDWGDF